MKKKDHWKIDYRKEWNEPTYYSGQDLSNHRELENYKRLADLSEFKENPKEGIKSSGYVVDTLEATVWCLLHSILIKKQC